MAYNRWLSNPQNGSELYHYGVKGMKWGKRLISNVVPQAAGGGGGAVEEDDDSEEEFNKAKEAFKNGKISLKDFSAALMKRHKTREALKNAVSNHGPKEVTTTTSLKAAKARKNFRENATNRKPTQVQSPGPTAPKRPRGRKRNTTGKGTGVHVWK